MKKISIIVVTVLVLGIIVLSIGCSSVKISDIQANPDQYEGKEVSLKGTVNETIWLGLLSTGAYQVDDGSGTIWIVTKSAPPAKGDKASLKGTVATSVKIGTQSLGTVVNETKRN